MKKILIIIAAAFMVINTACTKADFEDAYPDPSKISTSTVEKQFSGFITSNREYVLPAYWNYFVVLRTTLTRYTQAVGWVNASNQYVPGAAGIDAYWGTYYTLLAQYREFEKIYKASSTEDQAAKRIYMITATIYLYDHTQKMVDLHGDIPFSEAGMLSNNGGDYGNSLPKYDKAEDVYTKMLDDLKGFADELNTISVESAIQTGFKTQDVVNKGNLTKWKKYCNSLRLRMLNRVSGVASFQSRVTSETAAILANPASYPVIADNTENVQFDVINQNSPINSQGFQSGLEDWDGNLAGKAMIDHMNKNTDPRLRIMFEEGANSDSAVFLGLDPLLTSSAQTSLFNGGTLSIYNRSTLSRNDYFPGELMNSAEVYFLIAEISLRAGNDAAAKTAYNKGISQSVENYYQIRKLSNDNTAGDVKPYTDAEVTAYIGSADVKWENATSAAAKLNLIATQKWIHYSVVQPYESWSESRRLNAPALNFWVDNSNVQKQPPYRWYYGSSEPIYNAANYDAVKSKDNLTTKIFWDVN
jgi:hypothetical protein